MRLKRTLMIDDVRTFSLFGMVPEEHGELVLARNFDEGIEKLKNGPWDELMLDHDLASYDKDGVEKTGYDIMKFIEENPQFLPTTITFVTANPVGRRNMEMVRKKLYGEPV